MENCASILVFVMEKLDWDVKLNIWGFFYYVVYGFNSCLRGNCRTQVLEIQDLTIALNNFFLYFPLVCAIWGENFGALVLGFGF